VAMPTPVPTTENRTTRSSPAVESNGAHSRIEPWSVNLTARARRPRTPSGGGIFGGATARAAHGDGAAVRRFRLRPACAAAPRTLHGLSVKVAARWGEPFSCRRSSGDRHLAQNGAGGPTRPGSHDVSRAGIAGPVPAATLETLEAMAVDHRMRRRRRCARRSALV
jgi:hypothetical protein